MQAIQAGSGMTDRRNALFTVGIAALLVIGVLAAFSSAFGGELLTWDDQANFVENTAWRGLSWENLRWMATTFYMGHYQPLTWASFGLQHVLGASGPGAM